MSFINFFFSKSNFCHFRAHFRTNPGSKNFFQFRFGFSDPKLVRNNIFEFFSFKDKPKSFTSTIKFNSRSHEGQKNFFVPKLIFDYITILCVKFRWKQPILSYLNKSLIPHISKLPMPAVESLKRVKAITGQKQGNHTIRTVFFITVSK
jgi:hypothetical protein